MRGEHPAGIGLGFALETRLRREGVVEYSGRLGLARALPFGPATAGAVYECGGVLTCFAEASGQKRDD